MAKFLHVALGFVGKPVDIVEIQKAFSGSGWARYAPNCWILYSDYTPVVLVERLRALCQTGDSIFVCEIDMHNNWGYLQKEIWDWINVGKSSS